MNPVIETGLHSMQPCAECGISKPPEDFYPGKKKCKPCLNEYTKAWRIANRDKYLATQRRSDAKRKRSRTNPEHARKWKLKSAYGITAEQYDAMFAEQMGRCAACGKEGSSEPGSRSSSRLAVDHCHETGIVRGLLCGQCNRAEGLLKTVAAAEGLAAYMRKFIQ